ncbi:cytochrome P450 [Glutamicibacter mysorens]|nr:cytochrome P450 [Glutamicibacter mysorens]
MISTEARCPFQHSSATVDAESAERSAASSPSGVTAPVVDDLDFQAMSRDPYPTYDRLRTEAPIAWVPQLNKYLVTSYSACHAIEQEQHVFSANVSTATMTRAIGAQPMLRKDDPEHAADRAPINPVLRPKSIKDVWAPVFAANAEKYLDELASRGPAQADLNDHYAAPLAAQNLADLLGLKGVSVDQVRTWSQAFIAGMGNVLDDSAIWERCEAAVSECDEQLAELIPFYQLHPDASMISALSNSGLPLENTAANVKLTISGGMNEPQHMVTNMVWCLQHRSDQRQAALSDTALWPAVFDEAVRLHSPIGMYPRETTTDTVLEGIELPAGAGVGVVVGSANRDESHFGPGSSVFDLFRPKKPHMAFGSGVHLCAGHWAAKAAIGQIAVPKLYARFPDLRLDSARPAHWDGWVFRGLSNLPVTWN